MPCHLILGVSDNPKALDQILTQLAENSTAGRPVPATDDIISELQREVLTEDCLCFHILSTCPSCLCTMQHRCWKEIVQFVKNRSSWIQKIRTSWS